MSSDLISASRSKSNRDTELTHTVTASGVYSQRRSDSNEDSHVPRKRLSRSNDQQNNDSNRANVIGLENNFEYYYSRPVNKQTQQDPVRTQIHHNHENRDRDRKRKKEYKKSKSNATTATTTNMQKQDSNCLPGFYRFICWSQKAKMSKKEVKQTPVLIQVQTEAPTAVQNQESTSNQHVSFQREQLDIPLDMDLMTSSNDPLKNENSTTTLVTTPPTETESTVTYQPRTRIINLADVHEASIILEKRRRSKDAKSREMKVRAMMNPILSKTSGLRSYNGPSEMHRISQEEKEDDRVRSLRLPPSPDAAVAVVVDPDISDSRLVELTPVGTMTAAGTGVVFVAQTVDQTPQRRNSFDRGRLHNNAENFGSQFQHRHPTPDPMMRSSAAVPRNSHTLNGGGTWARGPDAPVSHQGVPGRWASPTHSRPLGRPEDSYHRLDSYFEIPVYGSNPNSSSTMLNSRSRSDIHPDGVYPEAHHQSFATSRMPSQFSQMGQGGRSIRLGSGSQYAPSRVNSQYGLSSASQQFVPAPPPRPQEVHLRSVSPGIRRDPSPSIIRRDSSPIRRDQSPIIRRDKSPVIRRDPSPVVRRDTSPAIRRDPSPAVVRRDSSPIRHDASSHVMSDPAPIRRDPSPAPLRREESLQEREERELNMALEISRTEYLMTHSPAYPASTAAVTQTPGKRLGSDSDEPAPRHRVKSVARNIPQEDSRVLGHRDGGPRAPVSVLKDYYESRSRSSYNLSSSAYSLR